MGKKVGLGVGIAGEKRAFLDKIQAGLLHCAAENGATQNNRVRGEIEKRTIISSHSIPPCIGSQVSGPSPTNRYPNVAIVNNGIVGDVCVENESRQQGCTIVELHRDVKKGVPDYAVPPIFRSGICDIQVIHLPHQQTSRADVIEGAVLNRDVLASIIYLQGSGTQVGKCTARD